MRAAYVWLFVSLAMLLLLPAYQFVVLPTFAPDAVATQTGFSHVLGLGFAFGFVRGRFLTEVVVAQGPAQMPSGRRTHTQFGASNSACNVMKTQKKAGNVSALGPN